MGVSVVQAFLLTFWYGLVFRLCSWPAKAVQSSQEKASDSYGPWHLLILIRKHLAKINDEAQVIGVTWHDAQTIFIWLLSFNTAFILYKLTGNGLLFIGAWFAMGFLPSCFIKTKYQKQRLALLEALVDCLRQLLAHLPDQGSLIKAIEMMIQGSIHDKIRPMLHEVIEEVSLGSSVEEALQRWRCQVKLRKFDSVADTLLQAHYAGWTSVAFAALDKAVLAMEADLRAVKAAAAKSGQRKKQLYLTILTAWSFPFILSLLNTGSKNIYLYTTLGKMLIFAYVLGTLIVIIKGQDYLSLNVDEL